MKRGVVVFLVLLALVVATSGVAAAQLGQPSKNVVIIGGSTLDIYNTDHCYGYTSSAANDNIYPGSGCFPVAGTDLAAFTFTAMMPANVNSANLAPYDTAFLNMTSQAMACNSNSLSSQAKTDLFAFVRKGGKLIIYDGECWFNPGYTWLNDLSFSTSNPGAMGASGTLNIVEDSALGTAKPNTTYGTTTQYRTCSIPGADPKNTFLTTYCINVDNLSNYTDAVGDANVMTTTNPWWNVNMTARNYYGVTGPVHTYALLGQDAGGAAVYGADQGIVIYNGLDFDYLYYGYDNLNLRKIWVQELGLPFNPAGLQGSVPLIGISLAPLNANKFTNTAMTLTATTLDLMANPQPGVQVNFVQTSGVNTAAYTCNPITCQTDSNGMVTATYTGTNPGQDQIKACFTNTTGTHCTGNATINWYLACDANGDAMVNATDINLILGARNTQLTGFDVRDVNLDGWITLMDARLCSLKCSNAGCK